MRFRYVVTLKRDNEKYIDALSIFLCVLSSLAFIYYQLKIGQINFYLDFAVLVIFVGLIYNFFLIRKNQMPVYYGRWLFIAGISWIAMPYLKWLSIIFFIFYFLEYQSKYPLEIGFSDKKIVMNSFIKHQYEWSEFKNIILKNGLLTLDFKNNRLFQREAIDDDEPDADEDEFNGYCKNRLGRD